MDEETTCKPSKTPKPKEKNIQKSVVDEINENVGDNEITDDQSKVSAELQIKNVRLETENKKLLERISQTEQLKKLLALKEAEVKRFSKENQVLQQQLVDVKKTSINLGDMTAKLKGMLSSVLTSNQVDLILNKKDKVKWTSEEMSTALTLRYLSKATYIFLRDKLNFPLPALATLQRHASTIELKGGIIKDVLSFMKVSCAAMKDLYKVSVLQIDEIKVKTLYEYDSIQDELIGPYSTMYIISAKGLFTDWKQPVYVNFDVKITKDIVLDVIKALHESDYHVVSCVSDFNDTNLELLNELSIDIDNNYFFHPVTNEKIYIFADAGKILTSIRNTFLNSGFVNNDGVIVNKQPLMKLNEENHYALKSLFTICTDGTKNEKKNLTASLKLFSYNIVEDLEDGEQTEDKRAISEFILIVRRWYDVMHSTDGLAKPYGKYLQVQNEFLDDMYTTILNLSILQEQEEVENFQLGVLISIKSLKNLFQDLKLKYKIPYLLTAKLNKDSFETLIAEFHAEEKHPGHPTPLKAMHYVKRVMFANCLGLGEKRVNSEDSLNEDFSPNKVMKIARIHIDPGRDSEQNYIDNEQFELILSDKPEEAFARPLESEDEHLMYLAGWLAEKFKHKFPYLGSTLTETQSNKIPSYVPYLLHVKHKIPSVKFIENVVSMNALFNEYHNGLDTLRAEKNIVRDFSLLLSKKLIDLPREVIMSFSKQKTLLRVKYLNSYIVNEESSDHNENKRPAEDDEVEKLPKRIKQEEDDCIAYEALDEEEIYEEDAYEDESDDNL